MHLHDDKWRTALPVTAQFSTEVLDFLKSIIRIFHEIAADRQNFDPIYRIFFFQSEADNQIVEIHIVLASKCS